MTRISTLAAVCALAACEPVSSAPDLGAPPDLVTRADFRAPPDMVAPPCANRIQLTTKTSFATGAVYPNYGAHLATNHRTFVATWGDGRRGTVGMLFGLDGSTLESEPATPFILRPDGDRVRNVAHNILEGYYLSSISAGTNPPTESVTFVSDKNGGLTPSSPSRTSAEVIYGGRWGVSYDPPQHVFRVSALEPDGSTQRVTSYTANQSTDVDGLIDATDVNNGVVAMNYTDRQNDAYGVRLYQLSGDRASWFYQLANPCLQGVPCNPPRNNARVFNHEGLLVAWVKNYAKSFVARFKPDLTLLDEIKLDGDVVDIAVLPSGGFATIENESGGSIQINLLDSAGTIIDKYPLEPNATAPDVHRIVATRDGRIAVFYQLASDPGWMKVAFLTTCK